MATINSLTSATSTAKSTATQATKDATGFAKDFDSFLVLLTSQLKNQDPTSPMDSNQFTQQLVMYSQVEQQIQGNAHLKTLIAQGQSSAAAMATGYLGKRVSVTNGQASLSGGAANWSYNLSSAASSAGLTVSNAAGKVVFVGQAETAAGNHAFSWDGKDNNGNALPNGAYKLTVTASDSAGTAVTNSVASAGTVNQIDMTGATPQLVIGSMQVGLGDIAAVAN